ncbi:MAG: phosphoenolpyruvate--protein phosphotransferase [Alphaproteobacteria bacterium]
MSMIDNIDVLKDIKELFESKNTINDKLLKILQYTKKTTKADSCECYVMINNTHLELYSFVGIKIKDSQSISFKIDEGLIGECATKQNIVKSADLKNNPTFINKLDTNEFNSLIAVPLIKNSKCVGVLALKNKKSLDYNDEIINILETITMPLSDLITSSEINEYKNKIAKTKGIKLKDKVKGISLSKGYGLGKAIVHRRRKQLAKIFADDKVKELKKFEKSYNKMIADLDEKFNKTKLGIGDHVEIFEAYKMLASDKGWFKKIKTNIEAGLSADASIERVYEDMHARLSNIQDNYLKERLHDLRDISDRLLSYINGEVSSSKEIKDEDIIVVAQTMGPADLMDYNYNKIRGLIIEDGTPTMHVSIVAKALGIPVIAKVKGVFNDIKNGQEIALDGNEGFIYLTPSSDIKLKFEQHFLERKLLEQKLLELKKLPAKTLDNVKIGMYLNVGLSFDLDYIAKTGADGVGLYRTEIPFMSSDVMPNVEKQLVFYNELTQKAGNKKVIFRSLDAGSDKLLPYWSNIGEENPAIGWRSIRITLDRRAILKKQLKAFIKASANKELNVMFPMIANVSEFDEAKETLLLEFEKEKAAGNPVPKKVNIGLMVEVPSVVYHLDAILPKADFVSVGTNDLAQFFFACDRGNPKLIERYDTLSAPFLKILKEIADKGNKHKVYTSVCGEMASNPIEAMSLIGLGYKNLSMSGGAFGKVKTMIRSMNSEHVADYLESLLESPKKTLRPQLLAYAYDHQIKIY